MTDEEFLQYMKEVDESLPKPTYEELIQHNSGLFESSLMQYLALGKTEYLTNAKGYLKNLLEIEPAHKHQIFRAGLNI